MISKRKILLLQHNSNDTNLMSVTSILTCNRYVVKEKDVSVAKQIRVVLMIP